MSSTTAEWLLEIGGLTVGTPDGEGICVEDHARALAGQLRTAAAAHRAITECVDSPCGPGCPLSTVDGGPAACRLAMSISRNVPLVTEGATMDRERTAMMFLQAVKAAGTMVFHCRRLAHPTGVCWFSDDGTDACGDILAVAHRVGC